MADAMSCATLWGDKSLVGDKAESWSCLFATLSPYFSISLGIGIALGTSVLGAAWYVLKQLPFSSIELRVNHKSDSVICLSPCLQGYFPHRIQLSRSCHQGSSYSIQESDQVPVVWP